MDPLTVAVDVGPLHGHRTGVGQAVAHLLSALESRDDVVTLPYLVSFRARPEPPQRRLPMPGALAARVWARTDRPRVDRWVRPAQVLHGTNYVAPPSRLPTLVSVYDCWFLAHPDEASPAVRRASSILRRAVARGAHVHVSSRATADAARELLGTDRVHVVHLGPIDPPSAVPRPVAGLTGVPFIVAVATLERRKNLPALVRAFGRLAGDDPHLRLVLAGAPGDDSDAVAAATAALPGGHAERVRLVGAVDDGTKSWLVQHAVVLAYPSLDEGFGFPILEAQATGTPVVARDVGSVSEIGGDGVHLVCGPSDDDLATALRAVLADASQRDRLVAAGRENVARFSWHDTAAGIVQLYRHLVEDAGTEGRTG
jgi:glycosyltransferase involved in cell wall biosynthesis